jgi:hypothetical protein
MPVLKCRPRRGVVLSLFDHSQWIFVSIIKIMELDAQWTQTRKRLGRHSGSAGHNCTSEAWATPPRWCKDSRVPAWSSKNTKEADEKKPFPWQRNRRTAFSCKIPEARWIPVFHQPQPSLLKEWCEEVWYSCTAVSNLWADWKPEEIILLSTASRWRIIRSLVWILVLIYYSVLSTFKAKNLPSWNSAWLNRKLANVVDARW